jgi:hypothetical protein
MPKFFPVTTVRTVVVEVPVGDASEVLNERLQYDNRNQAKRAEDAAQVQANVAEIAQRALETVTAALAAEVEEVNRKALDPVTVEAGVIESAQRADETVSAIAQVMDAGQRATDTTSVDVEVMESGQRADEAVAAEFSVVNVGQRADDQVSAVASIAEAGQRADDTIQAIVIPTADAGKRAVEDINASVTATANETGQRASDEVAVEAEVMEVSDNASDLVVADIEVSETAQRAVEDVSNSVTATASESGQRADDQVEAAIIARTDTGQRAAASDVVEVTVEAYLDSVNSNTGFTNPNNALGDTTGTAATLTATSSGLLGTTNNTTNGTHVAQFRDINLGDLTITNVTLRVENQHANAGLPLVQPTCNIQFQYSTNSGGAWTTFYTLTGQTGKGIRTTDLTGVIGQNRALLRAGVFRIRATGSVTSGTGLGAASTASYFRAWLTVSANRNYT